MSTFTAYRFTKRNSDMNPSLLEIAIEETTDNAYEVIAVRAEGKRTNRIIDTFGALPDASRKFAWLCKRHHLVETHWAREPRHVLCRAVRAV